MKIHPVNNNVTRLSLSLLTTKSKRQPERSGFALISVITIMPLLAIMAVAILNLSSVEVRTNKSSSYREEAQANARVALMKAIGQLQSLSGPDTRVTANSRLLSSDSDVSVTGVWRSWEGINQGSDGKPIAPDYGLKEENGDPDALPVDSDTDGRFLGWLGTTVSSTADIADLSDFSNTAVSDYIPMLGEGSATSSNDYVYVKPAFVNDEKGSIAWYTSGDNSKAMVNVDREDTPATTVEWQQRVRSNGMADAEFFGLEDINTRPTGASIPSNKTFKLVDGSVETRKFHDLTSFSRGLQINNATGGWKRDLSLFSEQYTNLPTSNLPTFTFEPGVENTSDRATTSSFPNDGLLYPWSTYRNNSNNAWGKVPPINSWTALVDYALQYKNLTSSSATTTAMSPHTSGTGSSSRYTFQEQVRRVPQIARIQWIFSMCSEENTVAGDVNQGKYKAGIMLTPVVTLWNPYNVELTMNSASFNISKQGVAPLSFKFDVGGTEYSSNLTQISENRIILEINNSFTLAPGASRVFSISNVAGDEEEELRPGYTPGKGIRYYGINSGAEVHAEGTESFSIKEVAYSDNSQGSIGIWIEVGMNGLRTHVRMGYRSTELGGVIDQLYPTLAERASQILDEVDGEDTFAFASAIFGYRMASPISSAPEHEHLYSKGMLQSNPLTNYSEVGNQDNGANLSSMAGSGVFHPINAPYDFAFLDVNGWNDTQYLPQFESSTNSSYIVSGLTAGDGLARCVMAELPTRPLQSLAQLQHFDARNNNPIPPFQFNLIGNGSAHPLFAPNTAEISTSANSGMVNDDTYYLNQMLFDDWFVSSIAPDLADFSKSEDRSYEEVYADHVNGDQPLPNRLYLPAAGAEIDSVDQVTDTGTGLHTYQTVASELVVNGMFNINSTSLDAWKAILRHSRGSEVPYLNKSGVTATDSENSSPYPRTSIAGDRSASSGSFESNSTNGDAAEFAGYRALTDDQIDALAEEIVDEVRARGPFLSLSEFVNRRLSTDKDLAIASTIQKALDDLSKLGSSDDNPYSRIQELSHEITSAPPGTTDYKFPEAALGSSAFGVPGWIRQADILTPLAPIITVRDDTFTIRAYGDVRDSSDSSKILASAWCEATVFRSADYLDPVDDNTVQPYSSEMVSDANARYGRRYKIIAFRWLSEEEI